MRVIKISIVIVVLIAVGMIVHNRLQYIEYDGIVIKMPYVFKKKVSKSIVILEKIPPDGTFITISTLTGEQFTNYMKKIVDIEEPKGQNTLKLKNGSKILIQIVSIKNAPEITKVYAYLPSKSIFWFFRKLVAA